MLRHWRRVSHMRTILLKVCEAFKHFRWISKLLIYLKVFLFLKFLISVCLILTTCYLVFAAFTRKLKRLRDITRKYQRKCSALDLKLCCMFKDDRLKPVAKMSNCYTDLKAGTCNRNTLHGKVWPLWSPSQFVSVPFSEIGQFVSFFTNTFVVLFIIPRNHIIAVPANHAKWFVCFLSRI